MVRQCELNNNIKLKTMKARHEFESDQDYKEYLKHYYAGLFFQGLLSSITRATKNDFAIGAIESANALIKALNENQVK